MFLFKDMSLLYQFLIEIIIGRTDAEAESPILWPPVCEELTHWKDPDAGKD